MNHAIEKSANRSTIGLTRLQAIPLAVGSIAGSGILFLPSAVYAEAGSNSLLVWLVSIMLCIPMLLMFNEMVRSNPNGNGIEVFVRQGLGETMARCVPVLFLALVIAGLPAGSIVAGRYLVQALGSDSALISGAIAVLATALGFNLLGVRARNRLQTAGTWALIIMSMVLLVSASTSVKYGIDAFAMPDKSALTVTLPTVVLAFWAFAGLENLTLLSREFRNPQRDFLPVSVIALGLYVILIVLLTAGIAVQISSDEVDPVAGLVQLAREIHPSGLAVTVVATIGVATMTLNAVTWVWGVSRMVADGAGRGIFPKWLRAGQDGVPRRTIGLLAGLFAIVLTVLLRAPGIIVDAIATASAVFVLMYTLCIVSYLRVRGLNWQSGLNAVLLIIMVASLLQSGWRSVYALAVLLVTWIVLRSIGEKPVSIKKSKYSVVDSARNNSCATIQEDASHV